MWRLILAVGHCCPLGNSCPRRISMAHGFRRGNSGKLGKKHTRQDSLSGIVEDSRSQLGIGPLHSRSGKERGAIESWLNSSLLLESIYKADFRLNRRAIEPSILITGVLERENSVLVKCNFFDMVNGQKMVGV